MTRDGYCEVPSGNFLKDTTDELAAYSPDSYTNIRVCKIRFPGIIYFRQATKHFRYAELKGMRLNRKPLKTCEFLLTQQSNAFN